MTSSHYVVRPRACPSGSGVQALRRGAALSAGAVCLAGVGLSHGMRAGQAGRYGD